MARIIAPTTNRNRVYEFLERSKRYHASCTGLHEYDVTPLVQAVEDAKRRKKPVGLVAPLIRATALLMSRRPALNRYLFHGLFRRYEVEFDAINCTVLVSRKTDEGEDVILPMVIRNVDKLSVPEIAATLRRYKETKLADLPEFEGLRKLQRMPAPARAWLSYKLRSDHRFYERYLGGTYGISSFVGGRSVAGTTTHALSPYACSFFPGNVVDRPWVVDGTIQIRKIFSMTLVVDHFLIDGVDAALALGELGQILTSPDLLGVEDRATSSEARLNA